MTPAEILRAAAELVERGWTQGVAARDAMRRECAYDSGHAVCFCAEGALWRVGGSTSSVDVTSALGALAAATPGGSDVPNWNDVFGRTAAEVAEAMRRAAASLDAAEHDPACVRLCCVTTPRDEEAKRERHRRLDP